MHWLSEVSSLRRQLTFVIWLVVETEWLHFSFDAEYGPCVTCIRLVGKVREVA
jgi:hypothetical protein